MYFHQVPRDRETEAKPTMLPGGRAVCLSNTIKHERQELTTDTLTRIRNSDLNRWPNP
jgi:hypothetical protein